jgi:EmrB/QacA subfamily drug resistance transporter
MIALGHAPCDEAVIRAGAAASGCTASAKPWVLAATILGSSLAFIDGSVVNVALPAIQADLAASVETTQWVVNAYLLMLGALILVGGAAGDRFGRRRVFTIGIVVFTAASVACGLAASAALLVAARIVQGIGGAMLVPGSLAIVSATFPEEERGRAIGTWAGFSALTTALGPVLGGALVDTWSWRAIFFINLPIALATLAVAGRHVPESRASTTDAAVDWLGGALATLGLGGLAYGLSAASATRWSDPAVIVPVLAGITVLAAFLWHEARTPAPMMPLALFRSRRFSGANAMTLLLYCGLTGVLFFLPFDLIRLQGYSAAQAGAAFLPFSLITGILSRWAGRMVDHVGARLPLVIGPLVVGVGFALLSLPGIGGSYWTTFFPATVVLGFGMAASVTPLTATVMGSVDQRQAGAASGINNAVARIAGLLAVALFGAIAVAVFGTALDGNLAPLHLEPALVRAMDAQIPRLAAAAVPPEAPAAMRQALEAAIGGAFLQAYRVVMLACAALAAASALCAALTIGADPKPRAASAPRAPRPS